MSSLKFSNRLSIALGFLGWIALCPAAFAVCTLSSRIVEEEIRLETCFDCGLVFNNYQQVWKLHSHDFEMSDALKTYLQKVKHYQVVEKNANFEIHQEHLGKKDRISLVISGSLRAIWSKKVPFYGSRSSTRIDPSKQKLHNRYDDLNAQLNRETDPQKISDLTLDFKEVDSMIDWSSEVVPGQDALTLAIQDMKACDGE